MIRNAGSQVIGAQMISATDGSAFTGAVTVAVTGDGGTQATGSVGSGACVHEGNGFHTYAPAQAETDFAHVAFTFTGTGAVPVTVQVYPSSPQTGDAFARLGAPAGASIAADLATIAGYIDTEVAAILAAVDTEIAALQATADAIEADTQDLQARTPAALVGGRIDANLGSADAAVIDAAAIATDAHEEMADTLLGRNIAGGSNTGRIVTDALRRLRNRVAIAAGTMTVYQENDTTAAFTAAVTTAAGDPVSEVDPA
jgi:hypothetical protein